MKKDIYAGCIEILKEVVKGKNIEDKEIAKVLTDKDLYVQVKEELLSQNAVRRNGYGGISMNDRTQSIIASKYYEKLIEDIEREEYDRILKNENLHSNIKYGKKGYRVSVFAIIISVLALILSVLQWLCR